MVINNRGGGDGIEDRSTEAAALKKGPWTAAEDAVLKEYVDKYGEGNWNAVQRNSGLARCGKSCRLRWANHLRPNLKKGAFSPEEERLILDLHSKLGNKWARMASQLPGRTDNEIKNYWNTRVKRRLRQGLPLYPQEIQSRTSPNHHHHQNTQNLLPSSPSSNSPMLSPHTSSPISLLYPNSPNFTSQFLTPPPLSLPLNRFKRYRSIDFSLNPQPNSPLGQYVPSPLGQNQNMFPQLPIVSSFSFGSANFDQNSSQFYHPQFKSGDGIGDFTFSTKSELHSNQNYQTTTQYDIANMNMKRGTNHMDNQLGSGLMDDMFRESPIISSAVESSRHGGSLGSDLNGVFDRFLDHWDDNSEMKRRGGGEEARDQMNYGTYVEEDVSNMKMPLLWYNYNNNNNNKEMSTNVQQQSSSSSILDDVDTHAMHVPQFTSSFQIGTTTNSNWDNNMHGIC